MKLFPRTLDVGVSFGVVRVVEEGKDIEVASFRTDGPYLDGRRPESIALAGAAEDALRRDFTINALFLDLEKEEIIDFVQGLKDLENGLIRTVGDPKTRFAEDHLRVLRALRFYSQLEFAIEEKTYSEMIRSASLLKSVSGERLREELRRLRRGPRALAALELFSESGMLKELFASFPEGSVEIWKSCFSQGSEAESLLGFFAPLILSAVPVAAVLKELEKMKPTKDEKKWVQQAAELYRVSPRWSLGEAVEYLNTPAGSAVLEFLAKTGAHWRDERNRARDQGAKVAKDGKLPPAFLGGPDVEFLIGAQRGEALKKAYHLQLENQLKSRDQALIWLQSWKKGPPL